MHSTGGKRPLSELPPICLRDPALGEVCECGFRMPTKVELEAEARARIEDVIRLLKSSLNARV